MQWPHGQLLTHLEACISAGGGEHRRPQTRLKTGNKGFIPEGRPLRLQGLPLSGGAPGSLLAHGGLTNVSHHRGRTSGTDTITLNVSFALLPSMKPVLFTQSSSPTHHLPSHQLMWSPWKAQPRSVPAKAKNGHSTQSLAAVTSKMPAD